MNLAALDVPSILRRYGINPDKRLGQNFLVDSTALQSVVDTAELDPQDTILEVGPGLGNLTRLLVHKAQRVIAIELDRRFIQILEEILSPFENVEIVQGDILKINLADVLPEASLPSARYKVVANIPYYITSALIRHLLEAQLRPSRLVLTVQREVAERIVAVPNEMNLLALSVQVYGKPSLTGLIPAEAFYPKPQVDSAIVRVDLYATAIFPPPVLEHFFQLAKAGFSQKRKTLRNSLAGGLGCSTQVAANLLQDAGIQPDRRAQTLSLEEWGKLAELALHRFPPTQSDMTSNQS